MAITTQIESAKETLHTFLAAYFDGWTHTVSGVDVEFPDCSVRMFYGDLPEGVYKSFDKPLITALLAPGASDRGQWVTGTESGSSAIILTWAKSTSAVGYYVYRSATEVGGYAKVSDLLTSLSYVDTPATGSYWYQVVAVDSEAAESDWEDPANHISTSIVYPKVTKGNEILFHIFVSASLSQGGPRIVDGVCSLLTALLNSSQTAYLKNAGLKYPQLTSPSSLRPDKDIWANSMFLRFKTVVEYE